MRCSPSYLIRQSVGDPCAGDRVKEPGMCSTRSENAWSTAFVGECRDRPSWGRYDPAYIRKRLDAVLWPVLLRELATFALIQPDAAHWTDALHRSSQGVPHVKARSSTGRRR